MAQVTGAAPALPPIRLRDMGAFHIGGRDILLAGLPRRELVMAEGGQPVQLDPNGTYRVEQMYAQYFLAEPASGRPPVAFWHGGGMTGAAWETTPDGRQGWLHHFLRRGWDAYLCDAVERGRAGAAPHVWQEAPVVQAQEDCYTRFRIGRPGTRPGPGSAYADTQFPLESFGQLAERFQRELRVGIRAAGAGAGARAADAKAGVAVFLRLHHGRFLPDVRRGAGAAAFDGVAQVGVPAAPQEMVQPALAAVGCGFPGGAGHAAAVPEGHGRAAAGRLGQEVLRVHLLDPVGAVGVQLHGLAAFGHDQLAPRQAGQQDVAAADVEGAHVAQADGGQGRRGASDLRHHSALM